MAIRMHINLELLRRLSEAFGPSGHEDEVRSIITNELKQLNVDFKIDKLGNIIVNIRKTDNLPKIILDAHMDEVGFLITHIDKNGFLRFEILGGIDEKILLSQRVVIKTDKDYIHGVIGAKAPHLVTPEERKHVPPYRSLFIDIGASSKKEAEDMGVKIGSVAVFDSKFVKQGNRIIGKAFDDRIGCYVLIELIKKSMDLPVNLVCVFSIQEEVGVRGAKALSHVLDGDYAIALECTAAADTPGVAEHEVSTSLGKGPALTIADKLMISDPKLLRRVAEVAGRYNIPYQYKGRMVGGTDAGAYQYMRYGIPSITISVPSRYIHSAHAIVDLDDLKNTINLVSLALKDLGGKLGEQP